MDLGHRNTEDKPYWCQHGIAMEEEFIHSVAHRYGLNASFNPEKDRNRYAVDLLVNGRLTDLKTVRTPLFTAGRYGYDPNFTVTLNVKDVERYTGKDVCVLFWVDWQRQEAYGVKVEERKGIWAAHIIRLGKHLGPVHCYQKRSRDGSGNATHSHLVDLRALHEYKTLL